MKKGIALLYHKLSKSNERYRYVVSEDTFNSHLNLLKSKGFKSVLMTDSCNDFNNFKINIPVDSFMITFDDGDVSNYTVALPLLMRYGYKATFFITTDWIGTEGYLNVFQLRELARNGMVIGSHTKTHPFLDEITTEDIDYELKESKNILQDILSQPVSLLSFPGGRYNKKVIQSAKKNNYKALFSSFPFYSKIIANMPVIGRCGIKALFSNKDLTKLVFSTGCSQFTLTAFYQMKFLVRKIIGNKAYYRFWSQFIGKIDK